VCEFRILFLGSHYFALRMDVDKKSAYDRPYTILDPSIEYSPAELPEHLVNKCRTFMMNMNLVFGAFDVILTSDNDYVFLEINQAGQFLFMEDRCPDLPLVDAMCHFLVNRSLDAWDPIAATLSLHDLERNPRVREREAARMQEEAAIELRQMRQVV
jgi:hypothetical protein